MGRHLQGIYVEDKDRRSWKKTILSLYTQESFWVLDPSSRCLSYQLESSLFKLTNRAVAHLFYLYVGISSLAVWMNPRHSLCHPPYNLVWITVAVVTYGLDCSPCLAWIVLLACAISCLQSPGTRWGSQKHWESLIFKNPYISRLCCTLILIHYFEIYCWI